MNFPTPDEPACLLVSTHMCTLYSTSHYISLRAHTHMHSQSNIHTYIHTYIHAKIIFPHIMCTCLLSRRAPPLAHALSDHLSVDDMLRKGSRVTEEGWEIGQEGEEEQRFGREGRKGAVYFEAGKSGTWKRVQVPKGMTDRQLFRFVNSTAIIIIIIIIANWPSASFPTLSLRSRDPLL
jgi:hypothetical protein